MTVVPTAFQLTGWIPAWWRGAAGGDDLLGLVGPAAVEQLAGLKGVTLAVTAYCPELGVSALPGPRSVTEPAVAAGEAVVLHAARRGPAHVMVPSAEGWTLLPAEPARPPDLDLRNAAAEMAEAVVVAEQAVREAGTRFSATPGAAAIRPLPPDADSARRGLLVRAVRLWTAVSAIPPIERSAELRHLLHACARATLAAYMDPLPLPTAARTDRARRPA